MTVPTFVFVARPPKEKSLFVIAYTASRLHRSIASSWLDETPTLRDCFFPTVTLKFRRALEITINPPHRPRSKYEPLRADGSLVIGFSGGIGSAILLDTIWRTYVLEWNEVPSGSKKPPKPPVWNKVWVAYVEQANAFDGVEKIEKVKSIVSRYPGFELVVLHIEDAFDPCSRERLGMSTTSPSNIRIDLSSPELSIIPTPPNGDNSRDSAVEALRHHLASLPSLTAVYQTISTYTRLLLQYFAFSTQSSHVLLGSSLTSLAISLISGVSQGGGFNVKEEKEEKWRGSVKIVRPLRDVGWKECALWAWWRELDVASSPTGWTGKVKRESMTIPQLTKDFIVGLERDYPSTVSTITRTCEKLQPKGESNGICVLCLRPAQANAQAWKEHISIRQTKNPENSVPPEQSTAFSYKDMVPLTDHLCYACHTTLTSRGNKARGSSTTDPSSKTTLMPIWAGEALLKVPVASRTESSQVSNGLDEEITTSRKLAREEMKGMINEFLLDE
ncbi:hypothetical protein FRC02_000743 [Tulasnella sp. 418]|nr:hypothetical protein FRC02_000743 [Tulasnella sp. 418]